MVQVILSNPIQISPLIKATIGPPNCLVQNLGWEVGANYSTPLNPPNPAEPSCLHPRRRRQGASCEQSQLSDIPGIPWGLGGTFYTLGSSQWYPGWDGTASVETKQTRVAETICFQPSTAGWKVLNKVKCNRIKCSDVLERWLHFSGSFQDGWNHVGSLKLPMVGIFMPHEYWQLLQMGASPSSRACC